jgi:chromosome segregation protein
VRAYSIIEQGQIAQLLTASKVDRRVIFEEAAGISKYKAQKKEALRKLERTEQNLLRLADIVGEVQKQLRSIKLQAGKARSYLQYSQRLKGLRVSFSLAQYHQIKTDSCEKNKNLNDLQNQFASVAAEVADKDAKISSLAAEIIEKENEINRCDNALVTITSKIEQQQQRIEFLNKRIEELQSRSFVEQQQTERLTRQLEDFGSQIKQCQTGAYRIEKIIADKSAELERLGQHIRSVNMACAELETELEDEKSGIIDIVRHTAQLHNEIQSVTVYRNNLHGQKERLSDKASQSKQQLEQLLGLRAQNQARLDDINKVISELQAELDNKREQIKAISEDAAQTNEHLARAREQRSAIQSETAVLTDMEDKQQGIDKAVREILNFRKPYIRGIVADIIRAQPEYAAAIEAALEGRTDAVIISDTDLLINDKEILNQSQGRVKFICTDRTEPFADSQDFKNLSRAVEFVSFEPQYAPLVWNLLGKTIIVESIEKAIELSHFCAQGYSFVTITGDIVNGDGSICAGPIGKAVGLISRKSRLVQLKQELEDILTKISQLEEKLDKDTRQNEHLERLCKDFRTSVYEANTEKTNIVSDLNVVEQNIKRLTDEQPVLAGEIQQLEKAIGETVQSEYASKQQLQEFEAVNSQRSEKIDQLEQSLIEKKRLLEQCAGELTELKVALGQGQEQRKATAQQIASFENQIQNAKAALISAQNNTTVCNEQIQQSHRDIKNIEAEISELFAQKETTGNQSIMLHEQVEQMLEQRKELEEALKLKRQEQSQLDEQIQQLKIELSQLEVKSADLVQRVTEELQMDLAAEYQNYKQEEINWDAVRDEITDLRGKIERLGNVNVDAIEQQDEL